MKTKNALTWIAASGLVSVLSNLSIIFVVGNAIGLGIFLVVLAPIAMIVCSLVFFALMTFLLKDSVLEAAVLACLINLYASLMFYLDLPNPFWIIEVLLGY